VGEVKLTNSRTLQEQSCFFTSGAELEVLTTVIFCLFSKRGGSRLSFCFVQNDQGNPSFELL